VEFAANMLKLSVARCASTSYKTVEGFDMTLDRAVALHDKLVSATPPHASPCEHQCYAAVYAPEWGFMDEKLHGNFTGFVQYRKTIE
jgi:hypothetical protein